MKTRSLISLLSIVGIGFVCCSFLNLKKNECGSAAMTSSAIDQLKRFTLIQDFPFYIKKRKKNDPVEFRKQIITLNRGVRYKFFTVRNTEYEGLPILSIYNNEKQEILLGSTYNSSLKNFYNQLEFECKTTGNYCLSFCFQDGMEGCALGVFASLIKE